MMTRNFNKVFEVKINPTLTDINSVATGDVPGLKAPAGPYTFNQEVPLQTSLSVPLVLSGGPYAGLYAIRDNWRLRTTATNQNGVQVQLTRNILNNRIPIFQFGIFYDDDLELFRPPRFSFGGRVHSNRHFFISPGSEGVYFDSRVTAAGEIITQSWRNGYTGDNTNSETYIKNASGVNKKLLPTQGSVLNGTPNIFASDPDLPSSKINPNWTTQSAIFDGNLQAGVKRLNLPLNVGSNTDLVEMIRRGKEATGVIGRDLNNNLGTIEPVTDTGAAPTADNEILRAERFSNKTGIRVSLADSKAKLPGCASGVGVTAVAGFCGMRLDGDFDGLGSDPNTTAVVLALRSRGYQPPTMKDTSGGTFSYVPTRVNGERLYTGPTRQIWIKVETVETNAVTGAVLTKDITQDILSLGVTEESPLTLNGYGGLHADNGTAISPSLNMTRTTVQSASTYPDSRSIIKLQRFLIPGAQVPTTSGSPYTTYNSSGSGYNYVKRFTSATQAKIDAGCTTCSTTSVNAGPPLSGNENYGHLKLFGTDAIVAFPIEMFDAREGEYYDQLSLYTSNRVTRNGVMSMVDIDVANLRRFLRGDFDGLFPTTTPFAIGNSGVGLTKTDIPQKEGWVFYVSDRRGDADFDGEYDMEDIYGKNDGTIQLGEDVNKNGILDAWYIQPNSDACVSGVPFCEAPKYADDWVPDLAAVVDHKYYRRGVRLINGTTLPGIYDSVTQSNTRGFTMATENGVYVEGNYNATGVTSVPATGNTTYDNYQPFNTPVHIPASIVADAVTILSNNWTDGQSFKDPYDNTKRPATDTTIRFAMISGDTVASKDATPNQGGISPRLNGGVHNFKRFLEDWTSDDLSYSGSLINLFNSRNNNGSFKCCDTVYDPPHRNWVFDSTFLDPTRLPPGTPFFQYVQTTGFERTNN